MKLPQLEKKLWKYRKYLMANTYIIFDKKWGHYLNNQDIWSRKFKKSTRRFPTVDSAIKYLNLIIDGSKLTKKITRDIDDIEIQVYDNKNFIMVINVQNYVSDKE